MLPCSFDESNHVLGAPQGMTADQCDPLSVCLTTMGNGKPVVISCWKPTAAELAEINKTNRIWLVVCGSTMPPVFLNGKDPFEYGGK